MRSLCMADLGWRGHHRAWRGRHVATVATAGHPPVLIRRAGGEVVEVGVGSFPLGAMAAARYEEERVDFGPGDILLLYSDGVVETMSPEGDQYGWDRLKRLLEDLDDSAGASEVRDLILREVWDFKGDAEQIDDVTMVAVRCVGGSATTRGSVESQ